MTGFARKRRKISLLSFKKESKTKKIDSSGFQPLEKESKPHLAALCAAGMGFLCSTFFFQKES